MDLTEKINQLKKGETIQFDESYLEDNQKELIMLVKFLLTDEIYINYLKQIWSLIREDDLNLIKFDLYVSVLKQPQFNKKIAKFICLKERNLKYLTSNLIGKCETIDAMQYLIDSYKLNSGNIITGISDCYSYQQKAVIDKLLDMLTEQQKNMALDRFMRINLDENNYVKKDLELVAYVLNKKNDWSEDILNAESIKKLIFFNKINKNLQEERKGKTLKI